MKWQRGRRVLKRSQRSPLLSLFFFSCFTNINEPAAVSSSSIVRRSFFLTLASLLTLSSLQCWWMTTAASSVADLICSRQKRGTAQLHRGRKALTHTHWHAQRFPDQSLSVLSLSDLHHSPLLTAVCYSVFLLTFPPRLQNSISHLRITLMSLLFCLKILTPNQTHRLASRSSSSRFSWA